MNHNLMMLVMVVPSHLEGCISYSSVTVMKHHDQKWFMKSLLWITDPEGRFIMVGQAWQHLAGLGG